MVAFQIGVPIPHVRSRAAMVYRQELGLVRTQLYKEMEQTVPEMHLRHGLVEKMLVKVKLESCVCKTLCPVLVPTKYQ